MALSPIAFTAPNYRDYKNYWLKAYEPGTTTPKTISFDDVGTVTVAKVEVNKDGFFISAGDALVTPHVDGAYDLWLFPTEAEADANDTVNAERLADNITGVNGATLANSTVIKFDTLIQAINETNPLKIFEGAALNIKERTVGNGGGAMWDVVLASSVTPNGSDIVQCIGVPSLALVRRNEGTNEPFQTVEQLTKYTMTPNRHVFGEEYLWGLHKHLIDTKNSQYIEFLWSGDSTTAGDNAGAWKVDVLGESFSDSFGLARHDHINKGHSGDDAVLWDSTYVNQDIASNPNMRVYITRWGINDGALHGSVDTYIAAMDSGLAKLRASKGVEDLTIIVMSPSSTYDEPNNRSTDWYEQIIPELRKICRKHMAVFFDTYSLWQDARQGALAGNPRWLDDPFGDGRGIHPDGAFNHQIVYRVIKMILEPVLARPGLRTNTFSNVQEVQFLPSASTVPNSYSTGLTLWTTKTADGWLVDGKLRVFRNGNKVIQEQFFTGVDDVQNAETTTPKFVRWGDATLNTWTKWYNAAVAPSLLNSWVATAGRIPKYVHNDNGSCTLMGTLQGGADTSVAFTLPVEMRPGFPRTFVTAGDGVSSNVIINTNGDVQIYLQGGTFANLDGVVWSAGN